MSQLTSNERLTATEATEEAPVVRAMYRALEEGNAKVLARYATVDRVDASDGDASALRRNVASEER